jgi:hypothetical protein
MTENPNQKVNVRPGKTGSLVLVIMGILFFIFGTVLTGIGIGEGGELAILLWIFRLIWWAACTFMVVYGLRVLLGKKPPILLSAEYENSTQAEDDIVVRMRKLEALRSEGLITEKEYGEKRSAIMNEKW